MVADFPTQLSSSTTWLKEERRRKKRTKKVVGVVSCTSLRQRVRSSVGARVPGSQGGADDGDRKPWILAPIPVFAAVVIVVSIYI